MTSLSTHISRLAGGHIPAVIVLEDMCRISDQFDRDPHYVLRQCANLQLGRSGLPELHEACGYDAVRCFKSLLAYEHGFVHREELTSAIYKQDEAVFHKLELIVNEQLNLFQKLDLPCYVS